jgi:tol-pal system protein YbgF
MALIRGSLLFLLFVAPGCFSFVTKEEGDVMRKDIADLQAKNKDLSDRLAKQNDDLSAKLSRLDGDIKNRGSVIADTGEQISKLGNDIGVIQGRLDQMNDLQKALELLQKNFGEYRAQSDTKLEQLVNASTAAKNPPLPETPDALYAEAQKRLDGRQYNEARRVFDAFINRFPGEKRAAQAQLNIGESYFAEGKYANAIGAYTKVIDNFPKSEEIESAMFKNGQSFFALKYCGDARIYFQELLKRYPKTRYKPEAMEQIKELTRQAKNKAICQS